MYTRSIRLKMIKLGQKGVIIAPILLWAFVAVSGLFVGTVAVKTELIKVNLSNSNTDNSSEIQQLPTATPFPSEITIPNIKPSFQAKPSPQGEVKSIQAVSSPTPDPDPVLDCKSKSGKIARVRRSVCNTYVDCQIGDDWYPLPREVCNQRQEARKGTQSQGPLVDCQVYGTTIKLPFDVCEKEKKHDQENKAYIESKFGKEVSLQPCTLYYGALNESLTYNVSKETCDKLQKEQSERNARMEELNRQRTSSSNENLQARCKNTYDINVINANQFSAGLREFTLQQAQSDYQRCLQGGSSEPLKITRPSPTSSPNYEGTQVYPWVPQ